MISGNRFWLKNINVEAIVAEYGSGCARGVYIQRGGVGHALGSPLPRACISQLQVPFSIFIDSLVDSLGNLCICSSFQY